MSGLNQPFFVTWLGDNEHTDVVGGNQVYVCSDQVISKLSLGGFHSGDPDLHGNRSRAGQHDRPVRP